ncbi:MAG: hypothetical protein ACR2O3_17310 [Rhizobiaceae bacterium]
MSTLPFANKDQLSFRDNLKQQKWLTLIGLPILLVASFNGVYAMWGLLFIYWGVVSVRSGEVYLLEPIERNHDPALFWIISMMWIGFGGLYVLTDYYPELWLY